MGFSWFAVDARLSFLSVVIVSQAQPLPKRPVAALANSSLKPAKL